jgi:hypothetical protein
MLRFVRVWTSAFFIGCGSTAPVEPTDLGRFETREVQIDPLPDLAAPTDLADAGQDTPSIDVAVFDLPAIDAGMPRIDTGSVDGAAVDGFVAIDRPFLKDRPMTLCTELAEQYATAVREAQRCAVASECGATVCETLCCTCMVYVSGLGDRVRRLDAMRTQGERMGCNAMLSCPEIRCPAPLAGACSTEGRCVTLREISRDASADR